MFGFDDIAIPYLNAPLSENCTYFDLVNKYLNKMTKQTLLFFNNLNFDFFK